MKNEKYKIEVEISASYVELYANKNSLIEFQDVKFDEIVKFFEKIANSRELSFNYQNSIFVDKLNKREVELLEKNCVHIKSCVFCKTRYPIYQVRNQLNSKIYICKKHLVQLSKYLKEMQIYGNVRISLEKEFDH